MPVEATRILGRKTIKLPSGGTVKIPTIIGISFIDPSDRYQESQHSIDNTDQSSRAVHVDQVQSVDVDRDGIPTTNPATVNTSGLLSVERVDTWFSIDASERYQETQISLDNVTGNDSLPPHFTSHVKSHIYRYHEDPANPDDNGVWIDSELIDEFAVIDPNDRYQETHYTLSNPTNDEFRAGDLSGQSNDGLPDITISGGDGEGTDTNPVRVDPFQNIVNWNGTPLILSLSVGATLSGTVSSGPEFCGSPEPPGTPHGGDAGAQTYQISANCHVAYGPTDLLADITGLPALPADFNASYGFFESAVYINPFPLNDQGNLHVQDTGGLNCAYQIVRDTIVETVFCNDLGIFQMQISFTQEEIFSDVFSLPSSFTYKGRNYDLISSVFAGHGKIGTYQRVDP